VTVGEAGYDISVFCPRYLSTDKVALVMVTAETLDNMNDPIASIVNTNMTIIRAANCIAFMQIERLNQIITVSTKDVNFKSSLVFYI
jgi:hypothetical protein